MNIDDIRVILTTLPDPPKYSGIVISEEMHIQLKQMCGFKAETASIAESFCGFRVTTSKLLPDSTIGVLVNHQNQPAALLVVDGSYIKLIEIEAPIAHTTPLHMELFKNEC